MARNDPAKAAAFLERSFGKLVREMRSARGWSQTDLAEKLEALGFEYHQTTIGKLETGGRPLRIGELFAMAQIFNVSAADMVAAVTGVPNADASEKLHEDEEYAARSRARFIEALDQYVDEQVVLARRRDRWLRELGGGDGEHPEAP